jgi:thiamine pyrophosphate-dependent acetolactate synthase large subunit-like protein
MSTASGGEVVVRSLERHGVEVIWGIPGTHNLEIYAHLDSGGIRHVLPRHEQGAAFAADGYARATGRPGVCLTTSGPAVLNAATALAQAWSDSVAVLLVSAGLPLRHPGRGNGYLHETKDLHGALQSIVAYSHRVTSVAEIPTAIAQAFATMTGGRPRPVHVEIPLDVLADTAEAPIVEPIVPPLTEPSPRALEAAGRRLAAASRPAILAGGGARGATPELRRLAELLGAPVVTTFNGKGVLDSAHPLAMGTGLHRSVVGELMSDSDTVVVVGSELAPADLWDGPLDLDGRVIRVDIDPDQAVANAAPLTAVVGDAALVLEGLAERYPAAGPDPERLARTARWRERFATDALADSQRWAWLLDPVAEALGPEGILVGDSATVCYYGAAVRVPATRPGCFLYPTGFGTLGYGLPAGIGAKLGRPSVPVIVLIGDGGIMFTLAELASAAALRIALPILVVDNGGYGEIRAEMTARGDAPVGVQIDSPDFAAVGQALGCVGRRVESSDQVRAALAEALETDRPTVIHVLE